MCPGASDNGLLCPAWQGTGPCSCRAPGRSGATHLELPPSELNDVPCYPLPPQVDKDPLRGAETHVKNYHSGFGCCRFSVRLRGQSSKCPSRRKPGGWNNHPRPQRQDKALTPLWTVYVVIRGAYEGAVTRQCVRELGAPPVVLPKRNRTTLDV